MNIAFNRSQYQHTANKSAKNNNPVAFRGEFEDIIKLAKVDKTPNSVTLNSGKLRGPKRSIEPTPERLATIKKEFDSFTKIWKSYFKIVMEDWEKVLKK